MRIIADLHIHSRFSRATSAEINIPSLSESARLKGIDLLGTGDFTHPEWLAELRNGLDDLGNGLLKHEKTYFILSAEVSLIYPYKGKTRRIHILILAPGFAEVEQINELLSHYGKLQSDGRPILALSGEQFARYVRQ
ncbi:MAG: endonuclease Q family protein, partial [Candidatus Sumerlaeia bacterium]|nr:endonuclease Q family protein [Candidatus Sumerlaeia bacterium]